MIYDYVVLTPTYQRAKSLHRQIIQMRNDAKEAGVVVKHIVFDDCSEDQAYGNITVGLSGSKYEIALHKMLLHYGKQQYWLLYTIMLQLLKKESFKYAMLIADDVLVCKDFFRRVTANFEEVRAQAPNIVATSIFWAHKTNWGSARYIDCGFLAVRKFLEVLEWQIPPVSINRFKRKTIVSSGVGQVITKKMAKSKYSLAAFNGKSFITPIPIPSVMFPPKTFPKRSRIWWDNYFVDELTEEMLMVEIHARTPRSASKQGKKKPSILKKPSIPKKIVKGPILTVIMPLFRAKYIAWLAFESLIRQVGINFEWELLIAEEVTQEEVFGVPSIMHYKPLLARIGCSRLHYVALQEWIPLGTKWSMLAKLASPTSVILAGHPADYYAAPTRLASHMKVFSKDEIIWHQPRRALHYLIKTGMVMLQDANKAIRKDNVPGKAMRTKFIRQFPIEGPRTGVDGWVLKNYTAACKTAKVPFKSFPDQGDYYKASLSTIGFNNISPKGRLPHPVGAYSMYKEDLRLSIPPIIIDRLEATREHLSEHVKALPQRNINGY